MIIKILKDIGLIALIIGILAVIGASIDNLIPWIWLTHFFTIVRSTAILFDVIIDLNALWVTTGIILSAWALYWAWFACWTVYSWYKGI